MAALSPADAWAVGDNQQDQYPNADRALIEHWDGTAWHIVPAPGSGHGYLTSVTAMSATNAWAAGRTYSPAANAFVPLLEHWNGQDWTAQTGPSTGVISQLSAVSATDIWAIGEHYSTNGSGFPVEHPVVYHYDGTGWQIQHRFALTATGFYSSIGIDARTATDAWAFALHPTAAGPTPVFWHWDGSDWTQVPGARLFTSDADGIGLAFASRTDGWLLGDHTTSGRILAEHWNGTSWSAATLPNWGDLYAITAVPHGPYWAAGVSYPSGNAQTKILRGP